MENIRSRKPLLQLKYSLQYLNLCAWEDPTEFSQLCFKRQSFPIGMQVLLYFPILVFSEALLSHLIKYVFI